MTPDDARRLLGLGPAVDESAARARHRELIRIAHPDAGGSSSRAADLNRALAVVLDHLRSGGLPAPAPVAPTTSRPVVVDLPTPRGTATEVLFRLSDAGHEIGEVVFVDAVAGLLEIVVGDGRDSAQLTVAVGDRDGDVTIEGSGPDDGVPVSFTLEPLAAGAAVAPIGTVVAALLAAARSC